MAGWPQPIPSPHTSTWACSGTERTAQMTFLHFLSSCDISMVPSRRPVCVCSLYSVLSFSTTLLHNAVKLSSGQMTCVIQILVLLPIIVIGHLHVKGPMSNNLKFIGICQIWCQMKAKFIFEKLRHIFSTSQKFGHTYSFKGFSLCFTIFYIVE